jgi:hypothetical protein
MRKYNEKATKENNKCETKNYNHQWRNENVEKTMASSKWARRLLSASPRPRWRASLRQRRSSGGVSANGVEGNMSAAGWRGEIPWRLKVYSWLQWLPQRNACRRNTVAMT